MQPLKFQSDQVNFHLKNPILCKYFGRIFKVYQTLSKEITLLDKRNALIIVTRSDGFEGKTMQTLEFHKSIHFIRQ